MAADWESTDWPQIEQLYVRLYQLNPSPVVALNRIVATGYAGQLECAHAQLDALESDLENYQPFYAARADLGARLGHYAQALEDYDTALSLTKNEAEREFLNIRRQEIRGQSGCPD